MYKRIVNMYNYMNPDKRDTTDWYEISDVSEHDIELPLSRESTLVQLEQYDENPFIFTNPYNDSTHAFYYLNDHQICKNFMFYHKLDAKIHLVMFAVNGNCYTRESQLPFLQFMVERHGTFPSFDFQCVNTESNEIDENEYFKNECLKAAISNIVVEGNLSQEIITNIENCYCGFLEIDDNNLAVIFNMSEFMTFFLRNDKLWMCLQEVKSRRNPFTDDFFAKYNYMGEIVDQDNLEISIPQKVYLYNIETNSYITNLHPWLEPRSNHPKYGNFYYFVCEPPPENTHCIRGVLFLENVAFDHKINSNAVQYLDTPSANSENYISSDDEMDTDSNTTYAFTSIVYFYENERAIYCAKTESLFTLL